MSPTGVPSLPPCEGGFGFMVSELNFRVTLLLLFLPIFNVLWREVTPP